MSCRHPHPIRGPQGELAPELEMIGSHATDTWARCRSCGAMFWSVDDCGKYMYSNQWELEPVLAHAALVEHDPRALARMFVSMDLPMGPLWDFTGALVEIFRALTPASTDAERATAIAEAGPHARWSDAALTMAATARMRPPAQEHRFPIDLRVDGTTFREWHEVGDALVLLTDRLEMLRLEPRGLTRLELAEMPRFLARSDDRLMLAVGDGAILVIDAGGQATTWPMTTAVTAWPLDEGWWILVPDTGEEERFVELLEPGGGPRVRFKRRFAPSSRWMPAPRRLGDGWIFTNLLRVSEGTQALTLVDASFDAVASSGGCPPAERHVTPIDSVSFWASTDGMTERWVRRGKSLEPIESFPSRSSWWTGGVLVTDTREGVVTARGADGAIRWTWKRATSGATYGVVTRDGVLFHDDEHAHWLDLEGNLRHMFDVESADARVARDGTVYVKTLAELWIVGDDARSIVVGTEAALEMTCGGSALLRRPDGTCLLVGKAGDQAAFTAKDASLPVTGTRGGPWLVEGDRIRGIFA